MPSGLVMACTPHAALLCSPLVAGLVLEVWAQVRRIQVVQPATFCISSYDSIKDQDSSCHSYDNDYNSRNNSNNSRDSCEDDMSNNTTSESGTMYPDWPKSAEDLVPLPLCQGPKLKAFDFQGPQKIQFLEYVGAGLHAHVFKVEILGQIYALKLFRFSTISDWPGPHAKSDEKDTKLMTAFANYSEPFNCECRAFGRLQESGNAGLAVQCFGYILLDEEHEKTMLDLFMDKAYYYSEDSDLRKDFTIDEEDYDDLFYTYRAYHVGASGRPAPIRGIVKEFGQDSTNGLRKKTLISVKRDIIAMQQLGIIRIDPADRNFIDGKISDFTTAITTPHYITTPELNPHLTPSWISAMEFETFHNAIADYLELEEAGVVLGDDGRVDAKKSISFHVFPRQRYELRKQSHQGPYTLVDPRMYDWKSFPTDSQSDRSRTVRRRSPRKATKSASCVKSEAISKTFRQLSSQPPRWHLDCIGNPIAAAKGPRNHSYFRERYAILEWDLRDGLMFPQRKTY